MYVVDNFGRLLGGKKFPAHGADRNSAFTDSLAPKRSSSRDSAEHPDAATVMDPPTVIQDYPGNTVQPDPSEGAVETDAVTLPVLGTRPAGAHQRTLGTVLAVSLVALAAVAGLSLRDSNQAAQQLSATGNAQMQSQRLAKSASQAMVGNIKAFPEVKESGDFLVRNVKGLKQGDAAMGLSALGAAYQQQMSKVVPLAERAERNAETILAQQGPLTKMSESLRSVNSGMAELLELADAVYSAKIQQQASAAELGAASQLQMLTQRIGKSANEFQSTEGVNPEAVFLLGKDLTAFKTLAEGLLSGNSELRLNSARDASAREALTALLKLFKESEIKARQVLADLPGLLSAREAQNAIVADSDALRTGLEEVQTQLASRTGMEPSRLLMMGAAALLALLCAAGMVRIQLLDSRQRQAGAERRLAEAGQLEHEAKRVNDANQAAILRLMNELQTVAEGDLTQEATVTEDITGAIADSVNYTVEELRILVGNVQKTATRVAHTTAQVDSTSTELLSASTQQLREIRDTGQSVLDMAARINDVSTQAQESAAVARQSLEAADSGLKAVQNAIGGMNAIRDQIQDTSKRIKRLGESSQEIGEITDLISDITEQTNVLALNAAIQAASAGEAGRGFSVVAEEVQRLAERSADATSQISALVKAIQTDTQDAVAAMERSTQGVVEGARLSDSAGTALTEIDRVSRRLAQLIGDISSSASHEAGLANVAAGNIERIFVVTEQTGDGTRSTAQQVRELSRMAEELRQSVSRFKIA
ncbi:MAG: methyl-accepting chemotaxis protein [Burkholderiales bacterium]